MDRAELETARDALLEDDFSAIADPGRALLGYASRFPGNVESRDYTKFLKSSDRARAPCLFLSADPETIEAVAGAS